VIGAASGTDYSRLTLDGSFTSGGASSRVTALRVTGAMTGVTGDTTASEGCFLDTSITTQASQTIGRCTQLTVGEPDVTVSSGSTVTHTASLYIPNAATEGGTGNYSLWVDEGLCRFDEIVSAGQIGIGTEAPGRLFSLTGTAASDVPVADFTNTVASTNFAQGIHVLSPNMSATHTNGLSVGQAWSSKNAGAIGFYWASSASDDSFLYLGNHSVNDIIRCYCGGEVGLANAVVLNNGRTTGDEGGVTPRLSIWFADASNWGAYIIETSSASASKFLLFGLGAGTGSSAIGSVRRVGSTSAVAYNTTSDYRNKISQGVVDDASAVLSGLTVYDFLWKDDPSGFIDRGFFAQEAHAVTPRGVTPGDSDPETISETWMMDRSSYIPDLVVGWQQHQAAIAALEARIEALENG
jgi:hypothetical protein